MLMFTALQLAQPEVAPRAVAAGGASERGLLRNE